jgi:hypothetical protein
MNSILIKGIYTEYDDIFLIEYHFKKFKVSLKNDSFHLTLKLGSFTKLYIEDSFKQVHRFFKLTEKELRELVKTITLTSFKQK